MTKKVGLMLLAGLVLLLAVFSVYFALLKKEDNNFIVNQKTGVSQPLEQSQIKKYLNEQEIEQAFWLGKADNEDIRVDSNFPLHSTSLAYTSPKEQKKYDDANPTASFNSLVFTFKYGNKTLKNIEQGLKGHKNKLKSPVGQIFILLPPLATEVESDIVIINSKNNLVGRIVYGVDTLNRAKRENELEKIAQRIQLIESD